MNVLQFQIHVDLTPCAQLRHREEEIVSVNMATTSRVMASRTSYPPSSTRLPDLFWDSLIGTQLMIASVSPTTQHYKIKRKTTKKCLTTRDTKVAAQQKRVNSNTKHSKSNEITNDPQKITIACTN